MLPSSAAACLVMLAHASWMTRRYWWATLWAVVAVLVRFCCAVCHAIMCIYIHDMHVDRRRRRAGERAGSNTIANHTTPHDTPEPHLA